MRRNSIFLAAMAAICGLISCNKQATSAEESPAQMCEVTIGIESLATKTIGLSEADQAVIRNLQVFIFNGNQLESYKTADNVTAMTLNCSAGDREIYALVNEPYRGTVKTKTELLQQISYMRTFNIYGMAMIGSKSVTLPSVDKITIPVDRFASRIVIKSIENNLSLSGLQAETFKIKSIDIINAPTNINYAMTSEPTEWENRMECVNSFDPFRHIIDTEVPYTDVYTEDNYFFCYPNPTVADYHGGTWCPRHTRLVVTVIIAGNQYYYPINLPVLEPNKSYEISKLTITRPGTDDVDTPITLADCTFEVNVKPWIVVPVTEGTTI